MNKTFANAVVVLTLGLTALTRHAPADVVTQWTFENQPISGAPPYNNSPTASTGKGTAIVLGMGIYPTTTIGVPSADIISDPGSSDPGSQQAWRIRAQDATGAANGWYSGAPQYTQGGEFDVSTAGFKWIQVAFDWQPTNRGVADVELQYNINVNNAAGWTNAGLFTNTVAGGIWNNGNKVDLSGVSAAGSDANFGIRIVSAYHGTTGAYQDTTGAALNNTSGNIRLDNVTVAGVSFVAVPEPSILVLSLVGASLGGLLAWRKQCK